MKKAVFLLPVCFASLLLSGCFKSPYEKHAWFNNGYDWELKSPYIRIFDCPLYENQEQMDNFFPPFDGFINISGERTFFMMVTSSDYDKVFLHYYDPSSLVLSNDNLFLQANVNYNLGDELLNWDVTYDPNFGLVGKTITFVQVEKFSFENNV